MSEGTTGHISCAQRNTPHIPQKGSNVRSHSKSSGQESSIVSGLAVHGTSACTAPKLSQYESQNNSESKMLDRNSASPLSFSRMTGGSGHSNNQPHQRSQLQQSRSQIQTSQQKHKRKIDTLNAKDSRKTFFQTHVTDTLKQKKLIDSSKDAECGRTADSVEIPSKMLKESNGFLRVRKGFIPKHKSKTAKMDVRFWDLEGSRDDPSTQVPSQKSLILGGDLGNVSEGYFASRDEKNNNISELYIGLNEINIPHVITKDSDVQDVLELPKPPTFGFVAIKSESESVEQKMPSQLTNSVKDASFRAPIQPPDSPIDDQWNASSSAESQFVANNISPAHPPAGKNNLSRLDYSRDACEHPAENVTQQSAFATPKGLFHNPSEPCHYQNEDASMQHSNTLHSHQQIPYGQGTHRMSIPNPQNCVKSINQQVHTSRTVYSNNNYTKLGNPIADQRSHPELNQPQIFQGKQSFVHQFTFNPGTYLHQNVVSTNTRKPMISSEYCPVSDDPIQQFQNAKFHHPHGYDIHPDEIQNSFNIQLHTHDCPPPHGFISPKHQSLTPMKSGNLFYSNPQQVQDILGGQGVGYNPGFRGPFDIINPATKEKLSNPRTLMHDASTSVTKSPIITETKLQPLVLKDPKTGEPINLLELAEKESLVSASGDGGSKAEEESLGVLKVQQPAEYMKTASKKDSKVICPVEKLESVEVTAQPSLKEEDSNIKQQIINGKGSNDQDLGTAYEEYVSGTPPHSVIIKEKAEVKDPFDKELAEEEVKVELLDKDPPEKVHSEGDSSVSIHLEAQHSSKELKENDNVKENVNVSSGEVPVRESVHISNNEDGAELRNIKKNAFIIENLKETNDGNLETKHKGSPLAKDMTEEGPIIEEIAGAISSASGDIPTSEVCSEPEAGGELPRSRTALSNGTEFVIDQPVENISESVHSTDQHPVPVSSQTPIESTKIDSLSKSLTEVSINADPDKGGIDSDARDTSSQASAVVGTTYLEAPSTKDMQQPQPVPVIPAQKKIPGKLPASQGAFFGGVKLIQRFLMPQNKSKDSESTPTGDVKRLIYRKSPLQSSDVASNLSLRYNGPSMQAPSSYSYKSPSLAPLDESSENASDCSMLKKFYDGAIEPGKIVNFKAIEYPSEVKPPTTPVGGGYCYSNRFLYAFRGLKFKWPNQSSYNIATDEYQNLKRDMRSGDRMGLRDSFGMNRPEYHNDPRYSKSSDGYGNVSNRHYGSSVLNNGVINTMGYPRPMTYGGNPYYHGYNNNMSNMSGVRSDDRGMRGSGYGHAYGSRYNQHDITLSHSENAWKPHSTISKYNDANINKLEHKEQLEIIGNKFRGLLNKVTTANFQYVLDSLFNFDLLKIDYLHLLVDMIFEKTLSEPGFCKIYAKLCSAISVRLDELISANVDKSEAKESDEYSFRKVIVLKCQTEFEKQSKWAKESKKVAEEIREARINSSSLSSEEKQKLAEREYEQILVKRRALGNVKFIGDLYLENLISDRVVNSCIEFLMGTSSEDPEEEKLESLCNILSNIGPMLDNKNRELSSNFLDELFQSLSSLTKSDKLSVRIKFMIYDIVELRDNKWQPKKSGRSGSTSNDSVHTGSGYGSDGGDRIHQGRGGMNVYDRDTRYPNAPSKMHMPMQSHQYSNDVGHSKQTSWVVKGRGSLHPPSSAEKYTGTLTGIESLANIKAPLDKEHISRCYLGPKYTLSSQMKHSPPSHETPASSTSSVRSGPSTVTDPLASSIKRVENIVAPTTSEQQHPQPTSKTPALQKEVTLKFVDCVVKDWTSTFDDKSIYTELELPHSKMFAEIFMDNVMIILLESKLSVIAKLIKLIISLYDKKYITEKFASITCISNAVNHAIEYGYDIPNLPMIAGCFIGFMAKSGIIDLNEGLSTFNKACPHFLSDEKSSNMFKNAVDDSEKIVKLNS